MRQPCIVSSIRMNISFAPSFARSGTNVLIARPTLAISKEEGKALEGRIELARSQSTNQADRSVITLDEEEIEE